MLKIRNARLNLGPSARTKNRTTKIQCYYLISVITNMYMLYVSACGKYVENGLHHQLLATFINLLFNKTNFS